MTSTSGSSGVRLASVAGAVTTLTVPAASPTPEATATLLVATDPALSAAGQEPGESLLLGASPVPTTALSTSPRTDTVAPAGWMQEVGTWGTPLLVGGALLLALTGPAGLRRVVQRRREG